MIDILLKPGEKCYRAGCREVATAVIHEPIAITPRKAVCEKHRPGAKF